MATEIVLPHAVWGQLIDTPGMLWLTCKLVELPILVEVTDHSETDLPHDGHLPVILDSISCGF